MKRAGLAALAVLLIAGCGTLQSPRTGTISPPTDALARWKDFPADQNPRPIVLLGGLHPKCDKLLPTFSPSPQAPKEATASWTDGTSYTYAAISAAEAVAALGRAVIGVSGPDCSLTAVRFATAGFRTDRGLSIMSAWLFTAGGSLGEIPYPALGASAFWPGPFDGSIGGGAVVSPSGRQLTFSFVGGPPDGVCAEDYTGVVAESPHAVAVAVQSNPGRPQGGPVACDLVGHIRSVTVQLASPLGGRVLVDASGAAVEACPEAIRAGCF